MEIESVEETGNRRRFWKRRRATGIIFTFLMLMTALIFVQCSPWPGAMVIRYVFTKGAKKSNEGLVKYVPDDVTVLSDQHYLPNDPDAFLDVYYPSYIVDTDSVLPVVVWIHGGGWVSGTKSESSNFYKILASKGFVVVSIDYSIAPEKKYPTPIRQSQAALTYIQQNAARFYIDSLQFFIAGDSGGAHIAAQVANIITNDTYSQLTSIQPGIDSSVLRGMLLYCGAYDVGLVDLDGDLGFFLKTILWAYSGSKNFMQEPFFKAASVIDYVDHNFPPSFITVGNGDPLQAHSLNFARKLSQLEVAVDTLFYAPEYEPKLPHEYQFNLDLEAGQESLDRSVDFLKRISKKVNP